MKRLDSTSAIITICTIFLGLVFFPMPCLSIDVTADEISRVAEAGKDPFIASISMIYFQEYGISEIPKQPVIKLEDAMNPDSDIHKELKKNPSVVLGDPFQVYTIETKDILNYNSDVDLSSILVPTTQWFVPVFIHNKPRAILTVDYMDGGWKVVSVGMGDTSEKVDKASKTNIKAGKNKFVRIYPALSDFIVTDTNGMKKILPFSYTVDALMIDTKRADSSGLYEPADIMPQLISHVKTNIKH